MEICPCPSAMLSKVPVADVTHQQHKLSHMMDAPAPCERLLNSSTAEAMV
eukprot:CAMPEP_0172919068 /NCGR_PEP_ID=MMETSP1075-20121228/201431_1 /TAXON_ID=2916 /ORGANISM="Ceratium fusus, Strain PA161109" /LENGTH=49 /DNA_ID= /DNA_START= /DNA_END= /DNA_ORIENTATION=